MPAFARIKAHSRRAATTSQGLLLWMSSSGLGDAEFVDKQHCQIPRLLLVHLESLGFDYRRTRSRGNAEAEPS